MNIQQIIKIAKNPLNAIYADSLIERLVPKRRKHAILISLPKSGTTWLGSTLVSLLDWQTAYILPNYGQLKRGHCTLIAFLVRCFHAQNRTSLCWKRLLPRFEPW